MQLYAVSSLSTQKKFFAESREYLITFLRKASEIKQNHKIEYSPVILIKQIIRLQNLFKAIWLWSIRMDIHIIRWGIHIIKDYPKTNQLNMLLTCYEGINHIWTARNILNSLEKIEMLHASSSQ